MPLTIKDYYNSNDYNGLFSWLLYNIRHGEFEELNNNLLKRELLRRFILHYFTTGNEMVLLVSIPDNIVLEQQIGSNVKESLGTDMDKHYFLQQNEKQKSLDFKLLENFLKGYFQLDSLKNISIKKLVTYIENEGGMKNGYNSRSKKKKKSNVNIINNCVVYNNEIHYLISDPIDGFKNDDWLKLRRSVEEDLENKKTRTISTVDEGKSQSESVSVSDASDILEIDFKHDVTNKRKHEINCNNKNTHPKEKQAVSNRDYMHSINSYAYSTDDSFGTKLEPVETRESDDDLPESEFDDLSLGDLSSFDDEDMASILPSISIRDDSTDMQFRLVLQSIIIIKASHDGSSFKMHTAIRQSNYLPYVATIDDDWLLYDDSFDIKNLQMCSLNDIWMLNKNAEKILFYSLVDISKVVEETEETEDDELNPHNGNLEEVNNNHAEEDSEEEEIEDLQSFDSNEIRPLSIHNKNNDSLNESPPQQLFDKSDESEHGIQLYEANTNVTNPLQLKTTITNGTIAGTGHGKNKLRKHLTISSYHQVERSQTISQNGLFKENLGLSSLKKIPTTSSTRKTNNDNKTYLRVLKGNRKGKRNAEIDDKNCTLM